MPFPGGRKIGIFRICFSCPRRCSRAFWVDTAHTCKGQSGAKLDESVSIFVRVITAVFGGCGALAIYFIFMYGMVALPRFVTGNAPREIVEIKSLSDADWNLVNSAELVSYNGRDAALVQIVDHGLDQANYPLALFAASKITYNSQRDDRLAKIRTAMMNTSQPTAEALRP